VQLLKIITTLSNVRVSCQTEAARSKLKGSSTIRNSASVSATLHCVSLRVCLLRFTRFFGSNTVRSINNIEGQAAGVKKA